MKRKLEIGEEVMIFEDPLTEKKPEGKAVIKEVWCCDAHLAVCTVEFIADSFVAERSVRRYA